MHAGHLQLDVHFTVFLMYHIPVFFTIELFVSDHLLNNGAQVSPPHTKTSAQRPVHLSAKITSSSYRKTEGQHKQLNRQARLRCEAIGYTSQYGLYET